MEVSMCHQKFRGTLELNGQEKTIGAIHSELKCKKIVICGLLLLNEYFKIFFSNRAAPKVSAEKIFSKIVDYIGYMQPLGHSTSLNVLFFHF